MSKQRVQKIIANAGYTSRRKAEDLIAAGRVAVNGETITLGDQAVPREDEITIDGQPLEFEALRYLAFYKPRNVLTSLDDPSGKKTLQPFLEGIDERVIPAGRLDYDAEGLLLLTNDGEWANRVMHPRYEKRKVYRARLDSPVLDEHLEHLKKGVSLRDGKVEVHWCERVSPNVVRLAIHEGRNKIVKRTLRKAGDFWVEQLVREHHAAVYRSARRIARASGQQVPNQKDWVIPQRFIPVENKYRYCYMSYLKRGANNAFLGKISLTGAWALRAKMNIAFHDVRQRFGRGGRSRLGVAFGLQRIKAALRRRALEHAAQDPGRQSRQRVRHHARRIERAGGREGDAENPLAPARGQKLAQHRHLAQHGVRAVGGDNGAVDVQRLLGKVCKARPGHAQRRPGDARAAHLQHAVLPDEGAFQTLELDAALPAQEPRQTFQRARRQHARQKRHAL